MTQPLATAAAPTRAAAPALTLDDRLALRGLAMDERLNGAGIRYDVRTAAIEIPEILVAPLQTFPATPATPTTATDVLAEAARLIAAHGRISRYAGSAATGYCAIGAIRAAAGGEGPLSDQAEAVLLDRIQAEQPAIQTIGAWNDAQTSPAPVLAMFDRAARHADRHGI
ncbi:hypothetical protein ACFXJO_05550 [Streptomyces lavendulae]|uniref:DUF6197 family protein n=1 Tax=Streptomyces lavendulae TaxID=1914 RepID=UPI0036919EB0